MPFQPGHKISGSRKGKPNRFKQEARQAIALFVDRNAPKLQRWLDAVANGRRDKDKPDGTPGEWIVQPNPAKAFELFQSVVEYHVPKLSRREVIKEPPRDGRIIDASQLTVEQREQLRQMILGQPELLEAPGLDAQVIEGE